MFDESAEAARAKWAQSIAKRGLHCERGMKLKVLFLITPFVQS